MIAKQAWFQIPLISSVNLEKSLQISDLHYILSVKDIKTFLKGLIRKILNNVCKVFSTGPDTGRHFILIPYFSVPASNVFLKSFFLNPSKLPQILSRFVF